MHTCVRLIKSLPEILGTAAEMYSDTFIKLKTPRLKYKEKCFDTKLLLEWKNDLDKKNQGRN